MIKGLRVPIILLALGEGRLILNERIYKIININSCVNKLKCQSKSKTYIWSLATATWLAEKLNLKWNDFRIKFSNKLVGGGRRQSYFLNERIFEIMCIKLLLNKFYHQVKSNIFIWSSAKATQFAGKLNLTRNDKNIEFSNKPFGVGVGKVIF